MKKKFLALVLTLAMVLSLVPVTALATEGTPDTASGGVVDGYYTNTGEWKSGELENAIPGSLKDTVTTVDKTAKKVDGQDNQYEVTLKVEMKQKKTDVPPGAAATVLVIDTSGSMNDKTPCNKEEHVHDSTCYTWEECTQKNHPRHYWWDYWEKEYKHVWPTSCTWDGNKYIYRHLTCNKEEHQHNNCGSTTRIEAAKVAAKNFLNSYRGGTVSEGSWTHSTTPLKRYVSVVWFNKGVSSSEWLDVSMQDGYDAAIASIDALSANEGTNLDAGLRMANAQLNNGTVKNMPANVVVLTDGEPTYYLKESSKKDTITIGDKKYQIKNDGKQCDQKTYDQTVLTANSLRDSVNGVYTVCFGASSEILSQVKEKPTVGTFLQKKVATQPEAGSPQKYAYDANDTTDLYKAFAAISSSVVSGLNTGTVTDALPNGVSCVTNETFDENGNLTWQLDPGQATKSNPDSNGYITYKYEKQYTVKIHPTAEDLNVVEGGYVPLNRPTKLTVKDSTSNRNIDIPFPIPAGKVTYSLTGFEKALVTNQNKPDGLTIPEGVTIPATVPVVISDEGVTLLYKITVNGDKGAKFTVRDAGATLVPPTTITPGDNSTFSGTVGDGGTTVFYVSKYFTQDNIETSGDTKSVSNTATIAPGDNAKGPDNDTATETTPAKEPDLQTYTVTYQWAEGERPSDADTLLPQGGTFTVDQKHTVADISRSSVTTNDAGKTGTWSCTWDKSGTIEGTANQEIVITGTWTFTENKPTTGNLIVKKVVSGESLTLNDLPTGSKEFKITVSGNGESKELSLKDSGVNVNESKTEATWTIPGLDPGEYTVSESNADVTGYDCTATYNATNGATVIVNRDASAVQNQPATDAQTVTVAADSTSTMTVTNKYTKQEVVPPTPADPVEWDVSCSKIASGLMKNSNGDWTTDVTLSIPSSEKQLVSDVLFILDESSCSEPVKASVNSMLDALYEQIENSGAKIKVGAVQFRGNVTTLPLTELTENTKTEITSFMSSRPEVGGTNMSAGLLKAQKMLDDDTSVMDGRKYVILVSDGITYIWDDETTDAQENLGVNFANADSPNNAKLAGPDGWAVKYGESYIPENWESHFNGVDSMMSTTIQNKASNYERGDNATIGKPFVAYGEKEWYTSTVDIALYKSYNAYKALQEKYNTYAVCSGVEKDMTDFPFGPSL